MKKTLKRKDKFTLLNWTLTSNPFLLGPVLDRDVRVLADPGAQQGGQVRDHLGHHLRLSEIWDPEGLGSSDEGHKSRVIRVSVIKTREDILIILEYLTLNHWPDAHGARATDHLPTAAGQPPVRLLIMEDDLDEETHAARGQGELLSVTEFW